MEIHVAQQAAVFAYSVLLGLLTGLFYECFRLQRVFGGKGRIIVFVQDLIFWFLTALATYCFLLAFAKGKVRLFVLVGQALGFIVYYYSVGRLVHSLATWIARLLRRLFSFLFRPFRRAGQYAGKKVAQLAKEIRGKCKKHKINPQTPLPEGEEMLYNNQK